MMPAVDDAPALQLSVLARSRLVVAGALLLAVGLGNAMVGRAKIGQYRQAVVDAQPAAPRQPAQLFPTANEADERRTVAVAKLGYYELLFTVGQGLCAFGFLLLAAGVLRARSHPSRRASS